MWLTITTLAESMAPPPRRISYETERPFSGSVSSRRIQGFVMTVVCGAFTLDGSAMSHTCPNNPILYYFFWGGGDGYGIGAWTFGV